MSTCGLVGRYLVFGVSQCRCASVGSGGYFCQLILVTQHLKCAYSPSKVGQYTTIAWNFYTLSEL